MLHTFIGADTEVVKAKVRQPFREYLRSAINLEEQAAAGGGVISGGHKVDPQNIPADVMENLLDATFERYFNTAALMGTQSKCQRLISQLSEIGVNEIACLVDFLDDYEAVMEGLEYLDQLRMSFSAKAVQSARSNMISSFLGELEC